jgi:hypothetical protein
VTTGELAAVLALALLLGVALISPPASASDLTAVNISEELANLTAMANLTNTSIAIVTGIEDIVKPEPHYNPNMTVPYIYQGDTVYLDTTIDISGAIPPYPQLAYWDGFDMYNSVPSYNITLPDNKKGYYHFYVDPEIFRERTGWWFKYDGTYEKQGNNRAFKVSPYYYENATLRFPNGTIVEVNPINNESYTEHIIEPNPLVPERHVADYVLARGDPLVWENDTYRMWLFGSKQGVYDVPNDTISAATIQALEPGNYKLVIHDPGANTIYEARNISNNLTPGLYGREPVNIRGMAAPVVYQKLMQMLKNTDDVLVSYQVELKEPYITIVQANEIEKGDIDALDVRGYTNVAAGTPITVTLDEHNTFYKDLWKQSANTTAIRTGKGNLSYYQAVVPFDYNDLAADARNHTLVARTALGGEIQKDFKISIMPADSFKPNTTLKYIEDRNPFIPTPTPEIVKVVVTQTVRVVERVTIPVTPSNEQVKKQQEIVVNEKIGEWMTIGLCAFAVLVIIGFAIYGYSVYRRAGKKQ